MKKYLLLKILTDFWYTISFGHGDYNGSPKTKQRRYKQAFLFISVLHPHKNLFQTHQLYL